MVLVPLIEQYRKNDPGDEEGTEDTNLETLLGSTGESLCRAVESLKGGCVKLHHRQPPAPPQHQKNTGTGDVGETKKRNRHPLVSSSVVPSRVNASSMSNVSKGGGAVRGRPIAGKKKTLSSATR